MPAGGPAPAAAATAAAAPEAAKGQLKFGQLFKLTLPLH